MVTVEIEGAKDSSASYDDDAFLQADEAAYNALIGYYEAGATVANVKELIERALNDAVPA